jgi:hypothetical protein
MSRQLILATAATECALCFMQLELMAAASWLPLSLLQARAARTVKLARQMALFPYEMRVGDSRDGDMWRRMREFDAAQHSAKSR